MKSLNHAKLARFRDLFYETSFVDILVDTLDGGTLAEGIQRQLKDRDRVY